MAASTRDNPARADRVIQFIELLRVPSGKGQGKPFQLEQFQKDFIRDIYSPMRADSDLRVVQKAILSIARKNGKTALIAALVLVHLVGPEAIANGEIYSAANDRDQAGIVFKFCEQIVRASPQLMKLITIKPSKKELWCKANGTFFKALSRDSRTKHGLNPSLWIYDELAQSTDSELYYTMDTSTGAREEPLGIVISTQNRDPQHILSLLIDDGLNAADPTIVCHLHAVPDDVEDIFDEAVWSLANPAIGKFLTLENMRAASETARRNPGAEVQFRNLRLNQRVDISTPLISRTQWEVRKRKGFEFEPGEAIYLGLDLATTGDIAAIVAVSAENGDRVKGWHWIHAKDEVELLEKSKKDRAFYHVWRDNGQLFVSSGGVIDYDEIASYLEFLSETYDIKGVAYDRWRINEFKKAAIRENVPIWIDSTGNSPWEPGIRFVPWGQGWRDMSPAIEAVEKSVLRDEGGLVHDGNPVLTYCISNASPVMDPAGNRKLDKSKTSLRIDGAQAMCMAFGLKVKDMVEEEVDIDEFINDPIKIG